MFFFANLPINKPLKITKQTSKNHQTNQPKPPVCWLVLLPLVLLLHFAKKRLKPPPEENQNKNRPPTTPTASPLRFGSFRRSSKRRSTCRSVILRFLGVLKPPKTTRGVGVGSKKQKNYKQQITDSASFQDPSYLPKTKSKSCCVKWPSF